jgi:hypothetical protein
MSATYAGSALLDELNNNSFSIMKTLKTLAFFAVACDAQVFSFPNGSFNGSCNFTSLVPTHKNNEYSIGYRCYNLNRDKVNSIINYGEFYFGKSYNNWNGIISTDSAPRYNENPQNDQKNIAIPDFYPSILGSFTDSCNITGFSNVSSIINSYDGFTNKNIGDILYSNIKIYNYSWDCQNK